MEKLFNHYEGLISREALEAEYYEFINNYLTVEVFAEHRGLTVSEGKAYLSLCRSCATNPNPEA